jgi:hypothetical protein
MCSAKEAYLTTCTNREFPLLIIESLLSKPQLDIFIVYFLFFHFILFFNLLISRSYQKPLILR